MKKVCLMLLIIFIMPCYVYALNYPKINSKVIEIYDINDDKILYEIDSKKQVPVASLTKIATVMTAIENIDNLDQKVTITKNILKTVDSKASIAGLKVGDKVTYKDLLYAAMLPSGMDAVNAIAILSSGSLSKYVEKMNDLVTKLNLSNTHFVNVNGLDAQNHYSTCDDIRKLLLYALNNTLFKEIYTTKSYTLTNGLKVKTTIDMYNKDAKLDVSKILGSKTGYTKKAGYCMASLVNINGHDMLVVVLNAKHEGKYYYNIVDTVNLIKFLNNNYKEEVIVKKDVLIKTIPVMMSNIDSYDVKTHSEITKYLPSDYNTESVKVIYDGLEQLDYHNKLNEKIGIINYYFDDDLIYHEDIILNTEIEFNIGKFIQKYYYVFIIFFLAILSLIVLFIIIKKQKRKRLLVDNSDYQIEVL